MERLTRPRRSAAERALSLIRSGFGACEVGNRHAEGLSAEEEDFLDDVLVNPAVNNDFDVENSISGCNGSLTTTEQTANGMKWFTYEHPDVEPTVPAFKPDRPVGPHLAQGVPAIPSNFSKAEDFFNLFFTQEIIQMLCENTNTYALLHILDKPTYSRKPDGAWDHVSADEMKKFIALVIMMGIITLPDLSRYWSTAPLYDGGWARRFMSRNRFKAMLAFLHISDPDGEDPNNKLAKLEPLLSHIKSTSSQLRQPAREISIDERMVKSKGRSGIRQYMPLKPVRFGYKLWCVCESKSGYTLDFNVYTGKREEPGEHGLAYDVVMALMTKYLHQGYHMYCDNYYTSIALLNALQERGVGVCGTTLVNRRGFPPELKDKQWQRRLKRGSMRYIRANSVLCQQWLDTKSVYICSTLHQGHTYTMVKRNLKDPSGNYHPVMVKKPMAVHDYTQNMAGVDKSDQLIQTYNVLLKSHRWWKTLFFHLIDISIVNSYLLFKDWCELHPTEPLLKRPAGYSQLAFREELIMQLAGIAADETAPVSVPMKKPTPYATYHTCHIPVHTPERHNCKMCYIIDGVERKTQLMCSHPSCNMYLCLNGQRNCMAMWHSPEFDDRRAVILEGCRHK